VNYVRGSDGDTEVSAIWTNLANSSLRLLPHRAVGRFIRQRDGATVVEFGLVALPFLGLLFAILQTALVFFAGQVLQTAVTNASRLIMTGQAQTGGYTAASFQNAVCAQIVALINCGGIYVNVQTYSSFASVSTTPPVTNGQLNTNNLLFQAGGPGDVVVVQAYYQWPIDVSLLGNNLSNLTGNNMLLVATAVFQNEPYK
jgi:Flp pilus assembly protein TadG